MPQTEKMQFPVFVEKDEDGFFVAECPVLKGCFTQGKTLDEALKNIAEVIALCLEDEKEEVISHMQKVQDFGFHTVVVDV